MRPSARKTYLIAGAALVLLIFLNATIADGAIGTFVTKLSSPGASFLLERSVKLRNWTGAIHNWRRLAVENEKLQAEVMELQSAKASADDLVNENDFLRRALNLPNRRSFKLLDAGIVSAGFLPDGHHALLNRGLDDGVAKGDVVITAEGILIGRVNIIEKDQAIVEAITDSDFKATARIMERQTEGIVRGALADGMLLDLITQDEEVEVGDTLVTSGGDGLPGGLLIGIIASIDVGQAQLFKNIRIEPKAPKIPGGRVIILIR